MGVFFYTKSVALVEDVPLDERYESESSLMSDMEAGFEQVSTREETYSSAPVLIRLSKF